MAISHLCHVAHLIDDIYSFFYLVLNFLIHIIESEFDVVVFLLLLLSLFKTVVPHETNLLFKSLKKN